MPICDDAAANPSTTPPATMREQQDPDQHFEIHETRLAMPSGPGHRSPTSSWHGPRTRRLPAGACVDTHVIGVAAKFLDGPRPDAHPVAMPGLRPAGVPRRQLAGGVGGHHDVLTQVQVAERDRAARPRHVIDVDAGLRGPEQLEAIQQPGGRVPERPGSDVCVQELARVLGIGGDDAGGEPGGLLVGDRRGVGRRVDAIDGDMRLVALVQRPLVAAWMRVGRQHRYDPERGQLLPGDRDQLIPAVAVDQQQVQPVADPEPVEARPHHLSEEADVGRGVRVEHAPAVGVRERADAVGGRAHRQLARGGAAPADDHERDQLRLRDQRRRAGAVGRPHQLHRPWVKVRRGERRCDYQVHERLGRTQRRAAGAQDPDVA